MINPSQAARAICMDIASHECAAKDFLEAWLKKVALRGYMPKPNPMMSAAQKQDFYGAQGYGKKNAEALSVRLGVSQAERNRAVQDFAASLRVFAKKKGQMSYADIDGFIRLSRKLAATRKGGTGRK